MSEPLPSAEKGACRCQIIGWSRDPYEAHIPSQPEWEQADDCPVHPLAPDAESDAGDLARVLAQIDSDAWASTFLEEWVRPYFGDDRTDAVAAVRRATKATIARVIPPGEGRA